MGFIVQEVKEGRYGTTQASILSLKAITAYMNNFSGIDEDGEFVLSLNGEEISRKEFTPATKEAIDFDISDYIKEHQKDIFAAGANLKFELRIETNSSQSDSVDLATNERNGFKLSYSLNVKYWDLTPPSSDSSPRLQS